ncbi:MAG: nicotinamide riboside transporter PnuC [Rikenellaceae bacterium]|nr:nicotinamide riboside transporter PnuC [Rikenellaceae bacterium]MCL2692363.1 nicotinamide riboside transporter PnuC [Rikenellaceae bacterium]
MELWEILEIAGAAVGLLYLWFQYRASVWLWPVGIVMPAIYVYIFFVSGVYANMGINAYYILAAIYGWWVWLRKSKRGEREYPVTRTPRRIWLPAMAVGVALFVVISWVLIRFTDSPIPFGDSFTTAFSIVALWMLARKWAEQWLMWLVIDGISVGLYLHLELYPTAALFAVYSVVSVFGYRKWLRMARI